MELYINDLKIDLDERVPFPLTYNISDIKDLKARKGNNSKTISIPGTKGNVYIFHNAFEVKIIQNLSGNINSFDFDPTIKVKARYYEKGLLQFNGYAQLTDCEYLNGEWTFNILLFSDQIDYIDRLSKIKINELSWAEYDHACQRDFQVDSWNGLININGVLSSNKTGANWDGLGYYYGLIDYGFDRSNPSTFNVEYIAPQIFCYDILKRSFEYVGLTWNSAFLESQQFKRLLLAYAGGELPEITSAEASDLSVITDEQNNINGYVIERDLAYQPFQQSNGQWFSKFTSVSSDSDIDTAVITDPTNQLVSTSPFLFQAATSGLYTIQYSGDHEVTLDFTISGATLQTAWLSIQHQLLIYKNGALINLATPYQAIFNAVSADTIQTISFNYEQPINLLINDTIKIVYRTFVSTLYQGINVSANPTAFSAKYTAENLTAQLNISKNPQAFSPNSQVTLSDFLPDMDAATFFKGFTTAFNLYVKPSTDDASILEIEPLNDFYDSSNNALQWTDKVDYSKSLKVTPTVNFASKEYNFKFAQDNDYYNEVYQKDTGEQYGSFNVDSQSQFNKDTTDFILPFSQKLLVNIPIDQNNFTNIVVPRSFQVKFNENGTSEIAKTKGKPFVVQLGPMTSANWTHVDENGTSHAETAYPYVGHLDSLTSPTFDFNFGVPDYIYYSGAAYTTLNLYSYHDEFIKEIVSKYGKQVNCYMRITPDMINQLDFKKLINIDGTVYRLQKISNYDSGKDQTTEVELIRIIKGEGLVSFNSVPPLPPIFTGYRITDDQMFIGGNPFGFHFRITEDGIFRKVE